MGLASSAFALDKTELNNRLQTITAKFVSMQQDPSTRVPADQLAHAQGVILLDRSGGAFIIGYHSGTGVALARDQKGHWSPPGFISSAGASLGAQLGGGKDFFVVLLMSPEVTDALKESSMDFGAQASATSGTSHSGAEASVNSGPEVIVYSQHNGLYAGAAIKGGSISADTDANDIYYDRPFSMDDILFERQVAPTPEGTDLISKIEQFSK
jgi:lipid-binding SYLF domain-containing protein